MSRRTLTFGFGLAITMIALIQLQASEFNKVVDAGDKAPSFSDLIGTDGKTYGLDTFADAKAVAVVFTCNECPVAKLYEDRLMKLAADYKDQGLALIAINVNTGEKENLEAMRERAQEKGFNFPYVRDDSQQSARKYGAQCTPHVFLLDGKRQIAYMGAIDDNMNDIEKVENHYLRDAVDAVLAGKAPAKREAKQFGCGIKWKD